ncbi:MAG: hypothetical protein ACRYGA_02445 [Janthinobacterium lividum]
MTDYKEALAWIGGTVGSAVTWLLWLRTKKSKDDTTLSNDTADRNRVTWLEGQRDKAITKAEEYLEGLRRAEIVVERQVGQIARQQEQIETQALQLKELAHDKADLSLKLSTMLNEVRELRRAILKVNPELAQQILSSSFGSLED